MPEEQNRVLTDRLSDLLFTHSPEAGENLLAEGISGDRIHYVGNTMIDTLRRLEREARGRATWAEHGASEGGYALVTLHRPSNVDSEDRLRAIVTALVEPGGRIPVVFPIHPRTRARLAAGDGLARLEAAGVACLDPLGYVDFLSLECGAGLIVTDSGGLQEEAAALGVPCYTLRGNTERPITISQGTNTPIGEDPAAISRVRLADEARRRARFRSGTARPPSASPTFWNRRSRRRWRSRSRRDLRQRGTRLPATDDAPRPRKRARLRHRPA